MERLIVIANDIIKLVERVVKERIPITEIPNIDFAFKCYREAIKYIVVSEILDDIEKSKADYKTLVKLREKFIDEYSHFDKVFDECEVKYERNYR